MPNKQHTCRNTPFQLENKSLEHGGSIRSTRRTAGGEDIDQFGVAPTGLFMADRNGNFSFQIMSIDGRRYAAKGLSPAGMGGAGIAEAMTYFGTYAVNERTTSSRCMWSIACFEAATIPTEQRN